MRTIIAGSRGVTDYAMVAAAVAHAATEIVPTVVISGTAKGVDRLGELWGAEHRVPVERFPADWVKHGKIAGHLRNNQMANNAEALIAVWDGKSPGTRHMINVARNKGLKVE